MCRPDLNGSQEISRVLRYTGLFVLKFDWIDHILYKTYPEKAVQRSKKIYIDNNNKERKV